MPASPNLAAELGRLGEGDQIQVALLIGLQQRPQDFEVDRTLNAPIELFRAVISLMRGEQIAFGSLGG